MQLRYNINMITYAVLVGEWLEFMLNLWFMVEVNLFFDMHSHFFSLCVP